MSEELLYPKDNGIPDWKILRTHLLKEGRLTKEHVLDIVKKAADILKQEPNLLKLKDPITVVGDIHGQYYDLVRLLEVAGEPPGTQYLFLGDYVDRGSYSIEVLLLIFSLKINYPKTIWLMRGNHECRQMTAFFNFRDECEYKFDNIVYQAFMDCFDCLPLAATINGKFLAIHGGLSPELKSVTQFQAINRFQEPPKQGIICDLLWSDPVEEKEGQPEKNGFINNDVRGCSFYFGYDVAVEFLEKNALISVIRGHEAQLEGFKMHRTNPKTGFPTVITIFSAPNYCDVYNNKGAMLKFENNTLNILQFTCSPHPYHLPNFMDLFEWSIPFVSEKITEMLYYIIHATENQEDEKDFPRALPTIVNKTQRKSLSDDQNQAVDFAIRLANHLKHTAVPVSGTNQSIEEGTSEVLVPRVPVDPEKADRLRNKIKSVGRMVRMFKTLRQENETIIKLKGVCPGHRLKPGLLLSGKGALADELERFSSAKDMDLENEKRPEVSSASALPAVAPAGVIHPFAPSKPKSKNLSSSSHR